MIKLLSPGLLFFVSIGLELIALLTLRLIGIDWDYHIDAVTYVEKSRIVKTAIFQSGNFLTALNNGYYILVDFLNSKPSNIITFNILLFGLTNLFIAAIMRPFRNKNYIYFEYLILFNPYRIYLGTTLLKDSLVCFLVIIAYYFFNFFKIVMSRSNNLFKKYHLLIRKLLVDKLIFIGCLILLPFIGLRTILYLIVFPNSFQKIKNFRGLIYLICLVFILNYFVIYFTGSGILSAFNSATSVNMDFRDYGAIPNFSSFGYLGIILKIFLWPFLYITGLFIIFSPSLELFFISFGISLVYLLLLKQKVSIPIGSIIGFVFFAGITNGFLSFARYSLPLWLISVIIIYCNNKSFIHEFDSSVK